MITDLWIENFKGIGKRQHIPLRPVTLLFGANSAGKSTVLHALLYLDEILNNRNFDPVASISSTNTISLGGFSNLVHRAGSEEIAKVTVTLGARFQLSHSDIDRQVQLDLSSDKWADTIFAENFPTILVRMFEHRERIETATIKVTVGTSKTGVVECKEFSIELNDDVFVAVNVTEERGLSGRINLDNEMLRCLEMLHVAEARVRELRLMAAARALEPPIVEPFKPRGDNETLHAVMIGTMFIARSGVLESSKMTGLDAVVRSIMPDAFIGESSRDKDASVFLVPGAVFRNILRCSTSPGAADKESEADTDAMDDGVVFYWRKGNTSPLKPLCVITRHSANFAKTLAGKYKTAVSQRLEFGSTDFFWTAADASPLPETHHRSPIAMEWHSTDNVQRVVDYWQEADPAFTVGTEGRDGNSFDVTLASLFVDYLLRGSVCVLREYLSSTCYVGPKRSSVPRDLTTKNADQMTDWGDGLAAWRWLLTASDDEFKRCSDWLAEDDFLNTAYRLTRRYSKEVPESLLQILTEDRGDLKSPDLVAAIQRVSDIARQGHLALLDKSTGKLRHPQDLGEGITQVVPILAALGSEFKFIAAEQPELHLHPSLAARMADILLQAVRSKNNLLIETHSEHIILRLLRRIRQTTDGELPEHIPPVKPDDVCVLYVDNLGDGTIIKRLRINEDGGFIDRWPHGFFSERTEELY